MTYEQHEEILGQIRIIKNELSNAVCELAVLNLHNASNSIQVVMKCLDKLANDVNEYDKGDEDYE